MSSIGDVMTVLRAALEGAVQIRFPRAGTITRLVGLKSEGGGAADDGGDSITISLVGLQSDASAGMFKPPASAGDDRLFQAYPPLYLDAYVMIAAQFSDDNYEVGLAHLSAIISYLQQNPVLTPLNAAGLPADVDKIAIEFVNLDFAQQGHLATITGQPYVPMAVYRLRRIVFAGGAVAGVAPPVRSADPPTTLPANGFRQ